MRKVKIKEDGQLTVETPLVSEFPNIRFTLRLGHATYHFSGRYDGSHSAPAKILRLMERDIVQKDSDTEKTERYNEPMQSCMEGCLPEGGN